MMWYDVIRIHKYNVDANVHSNTLRHIPLMIASQQLLVSYVEMLLDACVYNSIIG